MEQFRNLLIQAFNEAELPFDAKYYIIKDVFRDVSSMYDNMLKEQSAMANTAANTEDMPVEIEEVE
jgi:hypothetical protein